MHVNRRTGILISIVLALLMLPLSACFEAKEKPVEDWLVKIDGVSIPALEFKREIKSLGGGVQIAEDSAEYRNIWREVREGLIDSYLYRREAKRNNIVVADEEVEKQYKKTYEHIDNYEEYLKDTGYTKPELLERTRRRMMIAEYFKRDLYSRIVMKQDELKKYYKEHPKCYFTGDAVHVLQVTVGDEETAKKVRRRLVRGENLAKVAEEVGTTPDAKRGGDLAWIKKGQMAEPFDSIYFGLPKNKLSHIFRSDFGFHIAKIVDARSLDNPPAFEDVEHRVRECYFNEAKRKAAKDLVARLRKASKIEYNSKYTDKALDKGKDGKSK